MRELSLAALRTDVAAIRARYRRTLAETAARCGPRELSDEAVQHEAEALRDYLRKPGNAGASRWLDSKDFSPADRVAILTALHDMETP
jgi:hypothetical protein